MKRNPNDNYAIIEGDENWLIDNDTGLKMLFYIDRKSRIVVRSLLQEDIAEFVDKLDQPKEAKVKLKIGLNSLIKEANSQKYYFAIEKIVEKESKNTWDEIYGLRREPIGMAYRIIYKAKKKGKNKSEIYAEVFSKNARIANDIKQALEDVWKIFQ